MGSPPSNKKPPHPTAEFPPRSGSQGIGKEVEKLEELTKAEIRPGQFTTERDINADNQGIGDVAQTQHTIV
jgi:hypothetical protein